jgi:hypothetical protein
MTDRKGNIRCKFKNKGDIKLEFNLGSQDVECPRISIVCAYYKYTAVSDQRIFIIYTAAVSTTENLTRKLGQKRKLKHFILCGQNYEKQVKTGNTFCSVFTYGFVLTARESSLMFIFFVQLQESVAKKCVCS